MTAPRITIDETLWGYEVRRDGQIAPVGGIQRINSDWKFCPVQMFKCQLTVEELSSIVVFLNKLKESA